jgi:hypothetical protein
MNRFVKRVTVAVAAALFAIIVLAAGVEVWTRARWNEHKGTPGFFLSDPVRVQRLAPGYRGWFAGVPVAINQLGLRDDREYLLEKSPRTFRILVLGDSVAFGHGSVYEHTYPFLLEQSLKKWRADIDWQVWNAAVPGYNTSQELAYLLEEGPRFQPDLVVVGFFENDFVGNYAVETPRVWARARSVVLSFLYRHVYSIELYKRLYLQLAWSVSGENSYRQRLAHVAAEEQLTANSARVEDREAQQLTRYDQLSDEAVASIQCPEQPPLRSDLLEAIQHEEGWPEWVAAVRRFQQLHRSGTYRVVFFASVAPRECRDRDVFFDGGSAALNRFYMRYLSDGTPAVSAYDAFRRLRPSQMPSASGHALGNANAVKADVLFEYLRDRVLAPSTPLPRPEPQR